MLITIIATLMLMLAYFLILYAGVAFIQDKRFFGSAHKDILAVVPDRKERFKGAHAIGWIIITIAFLMYPAAFILGGWDGVKNGFVFWQFFTIALSVFCSFCPQTDNLVRCRKTKMPMPNCQ